MDPTRLQHILAAVQDGSLDLDEAIERLRLLPYENLGYVRIDHHRALRKGFGEVIYCPAKTDEQIIGIVQAMAAAEAANILATRIRPETVQKIDALDIPVRHHPIARIAVIRPVAIEAVGHIAVISAGTSDMPVAEEAAVTAETLGNRVTRLYDAGVAGIHRLLLTQTEWSSANVIIVVAGMEGALASVVGGMAACPVIGVPTSVGYGASFGGLAALLSMLNSCAAGVSVVNIDNGFGAACQASLINHLAAAHPNRTGRPGVSSSLAASSDMPAPERSHS
ncbi:MAG: nickel pincer cofactor biosynthesis protein LarB [Thermodesulfobacteriota bacterium]